MTSSLHSTRAHRRRHALPTCADTHGKRKKSKRREEERKEGWGTAEQGEGPQPRSRGSCHLCTQTPEPVGAMPGMPCAHRAVLFGCGPLFQLQPLPPVETQDQPEQGVADVCERDVCLGR